MRWDRIEITSGVMSGPARIQRGNVVSLDFAGVGNVLFIVEAIDADGGHIGLHDGLSHAVAVTAAREAATEDGVPVHDFTEGGADG